MSDEWHKIFEDSDGWWWVQWQTDRGIVGRRFHSKVGATGWWLHHRTLNPHER